MSIQFYNEDVDFPLLDYEILQKILKSKIRKNRFRLGPINYIFCSDEYLLKLNIKFLNHDYYTDVITFDYSSEVLITGDVYISTDRVRDNSSTFNQVLEDELIRVISHGLLHLLRYNDKEPTDILEMRKMEVQLLDKYISLKKAQ